MSQVRGRMDSRKSNSHYDYLPDEKPAALPLVASRCTYVYQLGSGLLLLRDSKLISISASSASVYTVRLKVSRYPKWQHHGLGISQGEKCYGVTGASLFDYGV